MDTSVAEVCMPMQLPQMMMPAEAGPGPASGSDGQVVSTNGGPRCKVLSP